MEEQLDSIINWSIENSLHSNAIFYAERFFERFPNQHSLLVLGNAYYRSGKVSRAYHLLKSKILDFQSENDTSSSHGTKNGNSFSHATTSIRYLFALCAQNLGKYKEAEVALLPTVSSNAVGTVASGSKYNSYLLICRCFYQRVKQFYVFTFIRSTLYVITYVV